MEEIQPLGYTEAKNIEEHKRIIDKINEMLVPVNSIEDDVGTVLASLTAYMNDTIVPAIAQITDALASVQQSVAAVQQAVATVSGYNTRLTDVEQYSESIGDDVAALDTELHTTRPYVDTVTEQTITAKKHIPTATVNDDSDVWVNKAFVQATDGRNNLVHNIASETINGRKNSAFVYNNYYEVDAFSTARAGWHCIYDIGNLSRWIGELVLARISNSSFTARASKSSFEVCIESSTIAYIKRNYVHGASPNVKLCHDANGWHILINCPAYIRTFVRLDTEVYTWSLGDSDFKVSENAGVVVAEPSTEQYDTIIDVTAW